MSSQDASPAPSLIESQGTLFGHPTGLFTLFFAEMWERFSYYGMRALLIFYMTKGFLGYGDSEAYAVYGAYTALVYMTPFFGGMIADRLIGSRRANVLGGLLMAAGHLALTAENDVAFFSALALLIVGNGFFKPNISSMVGTLYPEGSMRRDGGFTIYYMGINLGAAMAPLLCGYIGETYGWHKGFGLATIGMLIGVAVFAAPTKLTQAMIGTGALTAAYGLFEFRPDNLLSAGANLFVAAALVIAAVVAVVALQKGGLPKWAGAPPSRERLREKFLGPISKEWAVYLGAVLIVPVVALLVSGFSPLTADGETFRLIPEATVAGLADSESKLSRIAAVVIEEIAKPAGLILFLAGVIALTYLLREAFKLDKVRRERMYVVFILTFFSVFFWAFFEQGGSSLNNFADRNVDRVTQGEIVQDSDVGTTLTLQPTQEQLGYPFEDGVFTLDHLTDLREQNENDPSFAVDWPVTADHIGMVVAVREQESPASVYQSFNAIYILIFGLIFTGLWTILARRGLEPSTPLKFSLGLLQLGLGFGAFWYGAQICDERGMVGLHWLLLGYLLHTTGELCLSPVGLSMVTKLTPARLVSTVMGSWFLATAFSQYLAAIISQFTGVTGEGEEMSVPAPAETVNVYGDVFGQIAIVSIGSAVVLLLLVPLLKRWMHIGVVLEDEPEATHG